MLDAKQIEKAVDRKTKEMEIEAWGGTVLLAEYRASDRDWHEATSLRVAAGFNGDNPGAAMKGFRAEAVRRSLVNSNFEPLFGKDAKVLLNKSGSIIDMLFDEITALNDLDAKEELDAAAENLVESRSLDSGTN